jgi:hypothetical protein
VKLFSRSTVLKLSKLEGQINLFRHILSRRIVFPAPQAPCLFQLRSGTIHPVDRSDAFKDYYPRWKERR